MGGFTKEELNELNLGKNFKYPNTNFIENKASSIFSIYESETHSEIFKFTIAVFMLSAFILCILLYFKNKGMKISGLFKSLKSKIHFPKQNISSKTMIMPK